jgi:hypothetical protein
MFPAASCQLVPLAEVKMTGPGAPAVIHPADPCVTLDNAVRLEKRDTSDSSETRLQVPVDVFRYTAG